MLGEWYYYLSVLSAGLQKLMNRPEEILAASVGFFFCSICGHFQHLTFSSVQRHLVADIPRYLSSVYSCLAPEQILLRETVCPD